MSLEVGWYENGPDLTEFSQGDVLRGIPFPTWPTFQSANHDEKWAILRPLRSNKISSQSSLKVLPNHLEGRAQRDVPDAFSNLDRVEYIMASCRIRNVMVLSKSCSLDNPKRKHIIIAPVIAIAELPEEARSSAKLAGLRDGDIPHNFYLPAIRDMNESFADILMATSIHRTFLDDNNVRGQLVVRLSPSGTMQLQMQLAEHFGTQFGYDFEDSCPKDGWYNCSACFHTGRQAEKRKFTAGRPFGHCSVCGEDAKFVKVE
ncbi:MAG TPA: hypothetical protein VNU92_02390 [Edaphobacter sp.]|jgi:hypothetical protein|nr:hypothetical protein [Edaphobacter sp.]